MDCQTFSFLNVWSPSLNPIDMPSTSQLLGTCSRNSLISLVYFQLQLLPLPCFYLRPGCFSVSSTFTSWTDFPILFIYHHSSINNIHQRSSLASLSFVPSFMSTNIPCEKNLHGWATGGTLSLAELKLLIGLLDQQFSFLISSSTTTTSFQMFIANLT